MKNPFKKGDKVAVLTDLIAKTEVGLENLRRKRGIAEDLLDQGRQKRRAFIAETPDMELPADIRHAIGVAEDHVGTIDQEIGEYQAQLDELRQSVEAERQRAADETAARDDEALADFVDRVVEPELVKAAALIGAATAKLRSRLPADFNLVQAKAWSPGLGRSPRYREHLRPEELVAAMVAETLYAAAPQLFELDDARDGYGMRLQRFFDIDQQIPHTRSDALPGPAVPNPARVLLSDRLRRRAAERRARWTVANASVDGVGDAV